jgi:fermentation-respiration switch protein FrsA (DUF1100 family)
MLSPDARDRWRYRNGIGTIRLSIVAFSQTDFTDDLKKITVPVQVMHGDDDQIVPYADAGPLSAKLVKNGTLKTYKGFPHGMPTPQRSLAVLVPDHARKPLDIPRKSRFTVVSSSVIHLSPQADVNLHKN